MSNLISRSELVELLQASREATAGDDLRAICLHVIALVISEHEGFDVADEVSLLLPKIDLREFADQVAPALKPELVSLVCSRKIISLLAAYREEYNQHQSFEWADYAFKATDPTVDRGRLQYLLGVHYDLGIGVKAEPQRAISLYLDASNAGNPIAQIEMGRRYHWGEGVPADFVKARSLLLPHAQAGDLDAIGEMYELAFSEQGRTEDGEDESIFWLRLAARGGDLDYQTLAADIWDCEPEGILYLYLAARQGDQRSQEALELESPGAYAISLAEAEQYRVDERIKADLYLDFFRKRIDEGDLRAQYFLGMKFLTGAGSPSNILIEKDPEQALSLIREAAGGGFDLAKEVLAWTENRAREPEKDIHAELMELWDTNEELARDITLLAVQGHLEGKGGDAGTPSFVKLFTNPSSSSSVISLHGPAANTSLEHIGNQLEQLLALTADSHGDEAVGQLLDAMRTQYGRDISELSVEELIERDEGSQIEFKQTFSFNTRTGKRKDDDIRYATLKVITGFLNSRDGVLLIGVKDPKNLTEGEHQVSGIENDGFSGDKDKYSRNLIDVFKGALGVTATTMINIKYERVGPGTVCRIDCSKSPDPVYCNYKNNGEKPFVRIGSETSEPPHREWDSWRGQNFG
jgi:TPR repeat protein